MPLLFRLEDSFVLSNFQSLAKRCILEPSSDNQLYLTLIDKIYTFKYVNNFYKLTSKASSASIPGNNSYYYKELKSQENEANYYYDLQKLMCSACILESPRFVWTCWTPKCKLSDEKESCLLCTITINNYMNLWLPSENNSGTDMYKMENVLDISKCLLKDFSSLEFLVFGKDSSMEEVKKRVLFNLANIGYTSCHFVEPLLGNDKGFLGVINLREYIVLVWISTLKMYEDEKEVKEEMTRTRSLRGRKINMEGFQDFYEEEEEIPKKKKKKKEKEKVLGLSGFKALNKDFYEMEDFDITKCKDLLPAVSKVCQSTTSLQCKTIGAVKVDSCVCLYAKSSGDLNFEVYYSDSEGLKTFTVNFRLNLKSNFMKFSDVKIGEISELYKSRNNLECLKYFSLFGNEDYEVLTGFFQSTFLVYDLTKGVVREVSCGMVPLLSYSLEPLFMVQNMVARINIVNSDGCVYRLLLDCNFNLETEDVVDKKQEFVSFFTTSGTDLMVYDCLLKGSILEVKFNLMNKSLFLNLVLIFHKNYDLDFFLYYLSLEYSNLVPNSTLFSLNDTPNSFSKFNEESQVESLFNIKESNDPFYDHLIGYFSSHNDNLVILTCFVLYLFAFVEVSGSLPFSKDSSIVCNLDLTPFLSRMLTFPTPDKSKLLKSFQILLSFFNHPFLFKLTSYLSN